LVGQTTSHSHFAPNILADCSHA